MLPRLGHTYQRVSQRVTFGRLCMHNVAIVEQMSTVGWTDDRKQRQTVEHTVGQSGTYARTVERTDGRAGGRTSGRADGRTSGSLTSFLRFTNGSLTVRYYSLLAHSWYLMAHHWHSIVHYRPTNESLTVGSPMVH